ncbi:MAG: DUF1592 domain-containing protein [Gemmataceae bacterium]
MRCRFRLYGFCVCLATITIVAPGMLRAEPPATALDRMPNSIKGFVAKHCISCHGPMKQSGSLALHSIQAIADDRTTWESVLERVRANEMPPPKQPRPDAAERKSFLADLEGELAKVVCGGTVDPGRVTLRRLNRSEYNNTIRDLLALDFQPADGFPADDVGYGFDNIGDVLALSPLLLEKYLAAAEKIIDKAFTGELPPLPPKREFRLRDFEPLPKVAPFRDRGFVLSRDEATVAYKFPGDGDYTITLRANGLPIDKEPVKVVLKLDGSEFHKSELRPFVDGKGFGQREVTLKTTAGPHKLSIAIANPKANTDENEADSAKKERAIVVGALEVQGPLVTNERIMPEAYRRIMIAKPGQQGMTRTDAARKIIENFARRAFRRPARSDEVARFLKLVDMVEGNGESFEKGIQLACQAILVSPHFLFKVENDKKLVDKPFSISEHELAVRLSYFLWSSMPDDELFKLAEKGSLRKELEPQVRRMLRDPKARALGENFAGQWLQIRNLKTVQPDARLFPGFDDSLRNAMFQETALFFAAIVQEDRNILDFLDADFTFLNERLAKHYGIAGVKGDEFRRVSLKGTPRAGILTQASVLTVTSNVTRTSPVKRGKYIMENLLNAALPPPPPDAGELSEEKNAVESASLRQRMEVHRTKAECAVCHQRMDPIGFAFENFDAIGAWRVKDGKFDIDPSGELPDGRRFSDPAELRRILRADHMRFRRCLVDKIMTYALGRGVESADRCAVELATSQVRQKQDKFSELVLAVVNSEPFQKRNPVSTGKAK